MQATITTTAARISEKLTGSVLRFAPCPPYVQVQVAQEADSQRVKAIPEAG